MPARKAVKKEPAEGSETTGDLLEAKVVAFADQLGSLVGTVQARTEGWFDRQALGEEIARIRDSAADLFNQVSGLGRSPRKTTSNRPATSAKRLGRGPVDAPGKRHRKPPPHEPIDKRMGEPVGKQMGRKRVRSAKTSRRG